MADIFLSDMIRAVAKLQPESFGDLQKIVKLLGLGWIEDSSHQKTAEEEVRTLVRQDKTAVSSADNAREESSPNPVASSVLNSDEVVESMIDQLPRGPMTAPHWLNSVQAMSAPPLMSNRPVLEPLFASESTRHLLTASLQTKRDDGNIDLEKVIVVLANGLPLETLPKEPLRTLSRGVQVLVDKSETMLPFSRDQKEILGPLRRVVGRERVKVDVFNMQPEKPSSPWGIRQTPPFRGTPILLLTDLGIGGSFHTKSQYDSYVWIKFTQWAAQRGCPVIAFVPYPPSRWPKSLVNAMRIIQWDRVTTVSSVRTRVRSGWVTG